MRMLKWKLASVCAAILGTGAVANAAVLTVNFNSPTYTDGALNSPSPTTDTTTLGQDGWINTSGGGTNNIQVSNTATNGLISMLATGQDVRKLFNGSATFTSGSVYFTADINVATATATGDYALHLGDGSTSNLYARTYIKSSGAGYVLAEGTSTGTGVTYGTTVLPFNTVVKILVRYDIIAGAANDTGALYVNPTTADGSGDTPYVAATNIGTDATTIGAFYLRQGGATSGATLTVDNINVDVIPVPEPASAGLAGLAVVGLIARRRRQSRLR